MRISGLQLALLAAICLATPAAVQAATSTGNLTVEVGVNTACSVSNSTLNFLSQTANPSSPLNATTTLSINCTTLAPYTLDLGIGNNSTGGTPPTTRRMANSGNFVSYNLYQDSGHTIVWGSGMLGGLTEAAVGTGSAQTPSVFAQIPTGGIASQPTGEYTDTVVITVTF